ncbi:hypothetical protein QBC47DRAFT_413240 [Echria macrotheca]|uniref:PPPDE domain-containing protein n=1 Tax=Echria macrotheca TaxID=438768 RepID=A0AAJ0BCF5_9PEZI|nr:hypothetical protein QBC47DRAFT_413240 [Echria macrotheca]
MFSRLVSSSSRNNNPAPPDWESDGSYSPYTSDSEGFDDTNSDGESREVYLLGRSLGDPPGGRLHPTRRHTGIMVGGYVHEVLKAKVLGGTTEIMRYSRCRPGEWLQYEYLADPVYIGDTTLTDASIAEKANELILENPIYSFLDNNCQHFVDRLRRRICTKDYNGSHLTKPPVEKFKKKHKKTAKVVDKCYGAYRKVTLTLAAVTGKYDAEGSFMYVLEFARQ